MDTFTSSSMKPTKNKWLSVRSITLSAMLLALLVAQEEILILIPNVSLTPLLIMVYASVLPISLFLSITVGYVLLDNLIMGSLIPVYFVPMLFAWIILGLLTKVFLHKSLFFKVGLSIFFAVLYGWSFVPGNMIIQSNFQLWPYIFADLIAEMIMAISNIITITFLYNPLRKLLYNLYHHIPFEEK